ncbi:MAG: helix-turn-helix transcriptional regulator [Pseudomonadota bacterium]
MKAQGDSDSASLAASPSTGQGTRALVRALKRLLKRSGVTYADAAQALELSEASVKRLFSDESFTLKRMETLCALAGAELVDLVRSVDDERERVRELTDDQERELAADLDCLVVAISVLNRYRFEDVLAEYDFSPPELQRLFVRLDRLGIIELLPENRYRMRVARDFRWRRNGPIEQLLVRSVLSSFLDRKLLQEESAFRFCWGTLTPASVGIFRSRLAALADEFNAVADQDARQPLDDRSGAGLLLALRTDWFPDDLRGRRRPATAAR